MAGSKVILLGTLGGGLWVIDGSKETLRVLVDTVLEAVVNDPFREVAWDMAFKIFKVSSLEKVFDVVDLEKIVGLSVFEEDEFLIWIALLQLG